MRPLVLLSLFNLLLGGICVGQRPVFPLKASPNGRHFTDQSGQPFLYHADTGWQVIARLTLAEAREYFSLRQRQGFNTIQIMLSVNPDSVNRRGQKPFQDYDFARPDEAYFAHAEQVVRLADSLGLLLNIAPFWIGCCRESYGVEAKVEMYAKAGEDKSRKLGGWLGKRFGKYRNILWTMGGDNDPLAIRREIVALAEGLHAAAPHQLLTYHARPPHSSTDLFQYAPWLGYSMVYTYWREKPNAHVNGEQMPHVYEVALEEYLKTDRLPFVLGESQYEGNGLTYDNDIGSAHQVRRQAWWTMLSGGAGHAYGHDGWFFPANWREIVQYPGAAHLGHLIRFFGAIAWWRLVPDLRHQTVLQGYGHYTGADYVTAALTDDSTKLVAYLPQPGSLTVDLSRLKGPRVAVRWFNPRTGEYGKTSLFSNQGVKRLTSPLREDWVLVLTSQP